MESIFRASDYRTVLESRIAATGKARGVMTRLAAAAGCHPSYLSQVLAGQSQLTTDQAAGIAAHWALSEREEEYFVALVSHARAGQPRLRAMIERRLAALRRESEEVSAHVQGDSSRVTEENALLYYSSWAYSAAHMAASIPGKCTTAVVTQRLGLAPAATATILESLARMGLIERANDATWAIAQRTLHIPRTSVLTTHHHLNWRAKTSERLQQPAADDLYFSGVYGLAVADLPHVRDALLAAIKNVAAVVAPSKEETLMHVGIDCYGL